MVYQTFPTEGGASNSQAKLAALALPPLTGKKFLDVGCNEGYFCGYAFFDAASKVVGLDYNQGFIAQAKKRFPQCSFIQADWHNLDETLGTEKFDVILCASALHYADDQPAFVNKLMSRLSPQGMLALEIGILEADQAAQWPQTAAGWHNVSRSIDSRLFPTWKGVEAMLEPYVYKHMGPSVPQIGDPVPRHVFHIKNPQPIAVLLLGDPASGKSTVVRKLLGHGKVIRGDALLGEIGNYSESFPGLHRLSKEGFSWQRLDKLLHKIFESGAGGEYAQLVAKKADGKDFVFDGFVPHEYQDVFAKKIRESGYYVMWMHGERPEYSPYELSRRARTEARKYSLFLGACAFTRQKQ